VPTSPRAWQAARSRSGRTSVGRVLTFGGLLFSIAVLFLLMQEPDAQ
jgi:hypothetical protein